MAIFNHLAAEVDVMFRLTVCPGDNMKIPDDLSIAVGLFVISAAISALIIAIVPHA